MAVDLLTFDPQNPSLEWMYAHATLHRIFRANADGRNQFWPQVPGFKASYSRANLTANNFNDGDPVLAHYLIELESGWINILGGTEFPLGWPMHSYSIIEVPLGGTDYFPSYWYAVGGAAVNDIAAVIPANDARPIMFSGHSLGGASSVAAAYQDFSRSTSRQRSVVTFGSPFVRATPDMDGRDIPCCRVWNIDDMVPALPQHMLAVAITPVLPLLKNPLIKLYHWGMGVRVRNSGEWSIEEGSFMTRTILWAAGNLVAGFTYSWDPFWCHYMDSYAMCLRKSIQLDGVNIDPIWDVMNAYVNTAVGLTWDIPGFPFEQPPAQQVTPPAAHDLTAILNAAPDYTPFTGVLQGPRPDVPVIKGQSLATFLNAQTGTNFSDVAFCLSQTAVADPTNVSLTSFTEADFSGYERSGGPHWITIAPQAWTPARRFGFRAVFNCIGQERINTVYHWYAIGFQEPGEVPVLIDWGNLGQPFTFDRPRGMAIDFDFVGGLR